MCAANIIIVEKSKAALDHAMPLGGDEGVLIDGNEVEKSFRAYQRKRS
jgi:NAD+-dependent secondary alcohol dehydrogenase Adh1